MTKLIRAFSAFIFCNLYANDSDVRQAAVPEDRVIVLLSAGAHTQNGGGGEKLMNFTWSDWARVWAASIAQCRKMEQDRV